jgi:hypothetical protein
MSRVLQIAILALPLAVSSAPGWADSSGFRAGCLSDCVGHYDASAETTVESTVLEVVREPYSKSGSGTRLVAVVLEDEAGRVLAYLGPECRLDGKLAQLDAGQKVRVTGARVNLDGRRVVLVREVSAGAGAAVTLRDHEGHLL